MFNIVCELVEQKRKNSKRIHLFGCVFCLFLYHENRNHSSYTLLGKSNCKQELFRRKNQFNYRKNRFNCASRNVYFGFYNESVCRCRNHARRNHASIEKVGNRKKMCHYRKYRNYRKQQLLQPIGFCFSNRRNRILRQKTFVHISWRRQSVLHWKSKDNCKL